MEIGYMYGCPIKLSGGIISRYVYILYANNQIQYKINTGRGTCENGDNNMSCHNYGSYILLSSLNNTNPQKCHVTANTFTKLDNNNCTLTFTIYVPNEDVMSVMILQKCYEKEEKKDAVIYGLKQTLEYFNKYTIFRTVEEFDDFMQTNFVQKYCKKFKSHESEITKLNTEIECVKTTLKKTIDDNQLAFSTALEAIQENFGEFQKTINMSLEDTKQDIESIVFYRQQKEDVRCDMTSRILTPTNLLDLAVEYSKSNKLHGNIVDILKHMINSSEYILSDHFKTNKLDFKDIQFKFKMLASPESISKDEILYEVFNIDTTVSLI
jgi:hypothetical protein